MSKHTPGPWIWAQVMPGGPCIVEAKNEPNGYICSTNGNVLGNTPLIAAAPDLLEAAQAASIMPWGYCICPTRMGVMEGKPDDAHCGECRDLRAAIAKAKGEA